MKGTKVRIEAWVSDDAFNLLMDHLAMYGEGDVRELKVWCKEKEEGEFEEFGDEEV